MTQHNPSVATARCAHRTLLIGGSKGIGRATALELGRRGHDVAIAFHSDRWAAERVAETLPADVRSALIRGDVATEGPRIVEQATDALGGLDSVVFTAVPILLGTIVSATRQDAARSYDVLVNGFREAAVAALPHLEQTAGSIVVVTSLGAQRYAGYYGVLGPAKAAVETQVRYLAAEFGRSGVRVNGVSPCLVHDPGEAAAADDVRRWHEVIAKRTPLRRRLASVNDLAAVIAGLLSSDFRCVTGQIIVADGGYSLLA